MPFRGILACIGLVILTTQTFATTVLIVFTERNEVYVGTDSLFSDPSLDVRLNACKLHKLGETYWSAATILYADNITGFSLEKLVSSIGETGTAKEKMDRFIKAAEIPVKAEFSAVGEQSPDEYQLMVTGEGKDRRSPLEITFFEVRDGKPSIEITRFFAKKSGDHLEWTYEQESYSVTDEPTVTGVGTWLPAYQHMANSLSDIEGNPGKIFTDSLQAVVNAFPKEIGPPFSIIRLNAQGEKWIAPGLCEH